MPTNTSAPTIASLRVRLACLLYEALTTVAVLISVSMGLTWLCNQAGLSSTTTRIIFQLGLPLSLFGYMSYCWYKTGQTLAMFIWRIQVTRQNGQALSYPSSCMRLIVCTLTFWPLGLLWALIDKDRAFLHDRLLGNQLVRLPKKIL